MYRREGTVASAKGISAAVSTSQIVRTRARRPDFGRCVGGSSSHIRGRGVSLRVVFRPQAREELVGE